MAGDLDNGNPASDTDPQIKLDRLALQDHSKRLVLMEQRLDELEKLLRKILKGVEKLEARLAP